ncbi:mitochondrial E3 ubiquitin protein ligase 1-like [Macrosteles quadrilineatus]|uniref:mitochondrial E3 ubiquitin protein ligase 1-like n=1 Tax=Macrosteles quadrilineatus TaxID=74068 RepID=UPI0023E26220|nr:mitochondrial E3 ubiquitin protein ligase 1-like [Macrosteles quadrilineatus]
MSENRKDSKNDQGSGFGLGAAVLLGVGAAAAGFLAGNFFKNAQQSTAGPSRQSSSPAGWEDKNENLRARKKQRSLFKESNNIPDELKCVVCLDNPREICLLPCGHVCLCEDCSDQIKEHCPMCQQVIQNKKAIYI